MITINEIEKIHDLSQKHLIQFTDHASKRASERSIDILKDILPALQNCEIIEEYPNINIEKAKDAAMMEGKISSNKTAIDILNRLYNIMLVNQEDKEIVLNVFKDFMNVIKNNTLDDNIDIYISLSEAINDYLQNYSDFPIISDYVS